MDLQTRLESHKVATLKKEISKTNVKGYSKMRKAEVVALMVKNKDRFNHIRHATEPAPKKIIKIKKNKPAPEPEPAPTKKIIKVKKIKFKVKKGSKEEMHPEGIHIHINWKDGETELKKFKTEKEGLKTFKKIRAERKEKRDYKTMKLMDGLKALEYSA